MKNYLFIYARMYVATVLIFDPIIIYVMCTPYTCVRNMLEIKYTFTGRIYIYYNIFPAACIRNNSGYELLFEYVICIVK